MSSQRIATEAQWRVLRAKFDSWNWDEFPQRITIEEDDGEPVDDCFAVFFIWMKQLATEFTRRSKHEIYTVDTMHDIMCHKFLGYTEERKVGNTIIQPALITLTYPKRQLKKPMCLLLDRIDEWALDHGIFLITKQTSEYAKYKEAQ